MLTGGVGDDNYVIQNTGDRIVELANEGTDYVYTTANHTLAFVGWVKRATPCRRQARECRPNGQTAVKKKGASDDRNIERAGQRRVGSSLALDANLQVAPSIAA